MRNRNTATGAQHRWPYYDGQCKLESVSSQLPSILFERLKPSVELPARATANSAGYDLKAFLEGYESIRFHLDGKEFERRPEAGSNDPFIGVPSGATAIIPLGFRATLPPGYEAQIRPRSGTSFRTSLVIANAPGTIDPDYHGEWGVLVRNEGRESLTIRHGERIAQMVISRYEVLDFVEGDVTRTTDREGGFGSTGRG